MGGVIHAIMEFVKMGRPSLAFLVAGVLFVVGLGLGAKAEMRRGWLLAALSLAYMGLRLYTYAQ